MTLGAAIEAALSAATGRAVHVHDLHQLAGGASQEAWSFDLSLHDEADRRTLVMRRDMGGTLTFAALSREAEFAVLRAAFASGVRVAEPLFSAMTIAERPAFFMQRMPGEAVGRRLVNDPAFAEARAALPEQLAEALAGIHRIDWRTHNLASVVTGADEATQPLEAEIVRLYRELDSLDEPHPALEIALRWLTLHRVPHSGGTVLVHGDFRMGNVLVEPSGLSAVLDWEFAHLGDPYEDIAWFLVRAWRFGADALEGGGIMTRERWLQAYERASGRSVDRTLVAYWEIVGNVKWAIGARMQAQRHLDGLERSIELASLGRICAEMEAEALRLIERAA